jgi:hypothetical protein
MDSFEGRDVRIADNWDVDFRPGWLSLIEMLRIEELKMGGRTVLERVSVWVCSVSHVA